MWWEQLGLLDDPAAVDYEAALSPKGGTRKAPPGGPRVKWDFCRQGGAPGAVARQPNIPPAGGGGGSQTPSGPWEPKRLQGCQAPNPPDPQRDPEGHGEGGGGRGT